MSVAYVAEVNHTILYFYNPLGMKNSLSVH